MLSVDPSTHPLHSLEALQRAGMRVVRLSFSDLHGVCRSKDLPHSGAQREYQVGTRRHSARGFRTITVSSIDSGAGSVGVSARPAFPSTRSTSGNRLMMRSVAWSRCCAFAIDIPGAVDGMYKRVPSSSGGMNSEPRR